MKFPGFALQKAVSNSFKRAIFLFLIYAGIGFAPLHAQGILTPAQAIELGLQNNFSIRVVRNDAKIAENNSSLGNAGFLPEIDASAGIEKNIRDSKQQYITGNTIDRTGAKTDSRVASVSLNWTVFDGLKMFASFNRLNELEKLGEINLKNEMEFTVSEILDGYYNTVSQKQQLKFLQESVDLSLERHRIARANYEIGSGSRLAMLQALVDLNADSSALLRQESVLRQSKIALNILLARDINADFAVIDSIKLKSELKYRELTDAAFQKNTLLIAAKKNRRVAELELREIRSEYLPRISLIADYDWTKSSSESGFLLENETSGYTYGARLTWNLFNGFNTRRQSQNAKITIRSQNLRIEETKLQVEGDLSRLFEEYQNGLKRVKLERENLEVARQNLDISFEEYRIGSISSIELREAQRNLLDAESRLLAAEFDAKQAETELLRIAGILIENESYPE